MEKKLAALPEDSYVKRVLAEQVKHMKQQINHINPQDKFPPLLPFAWENDLEVIQALDQDINLVVMHTPEKRKSAVTKFLEAGAGDDRRWTSGVFEIFVKSRLLRALKSSVQLDYPLPNGRDVDVRLEMNGRFFYLECTVLTDSDIDRYVFSIDLFHDPIRIERKVKEKLDQLTGDGPNILLLALSGVALRSHPQLIELAQESESLKSLLSNPAIQNLSAVFLFDCDSVSLKVTLKHVWVNPNAHEACKVSDLEIEALKNYLAAMDIVVKTNFQSQANLRRQQYLRWLPWSCQHQSQILQRLSPLLLQGLQRTRRHRMGFGTLHRLVAASCLSDNHRTPKRPLRPMVARLHSLIIEEPQEMSPLLSQPLTKRALSASVNRRLSAIRESNIASQLTPPRLNSRLSPTLLPPQR